MTAYDARLRLSWTDDEPIDVMIDLTEDRITMRSGDVEVADWALDEVRVSPHLDGFHIRAEGEEIILDVTEDARFALDLGLRNAPPLLRRRMSTLLRSRPLSQPHSVKIRGGRSRLDPHRTNTHPFCAGLRR